MVIPFHYNRERLILMPKRDKNIKEITLKSGAKRYKYNTYIGLDPVTGERVFANGTYDN